MRSIALHWIPFALLILPASVQAEIVVGNRQPFALSPAASLESNGAWTHTIRVKDASFLKARLVDFELRPGDLLITRDQAGRVIEKLQGKGPKKLGSFWTLSAFGEELHFELQFQEPYASPPFRIEEIVTGFPGLFGSGGSGQGEEGPENVCGPANFRDAICFQSDPGRWANVLGSVGVMTVGGDADQGALFCSGSNVSPSNYVLTNDHCLGSQADCNVAEFVFNYYHTLCGGGSTSAWTGFRCDQMVVNSRFSLCEATPSTLDFSLCSVIGDPAAVYGYVEPDPTPLTNGEGIYIVQHPRGRPHEISEGSGSNVEVDGSNIRYFNTLDTEPGSSGSPIFRDADDKLVGLHHCGGCNTAAGNRGMMMSDIYPLIEPYLAPPPAPCEDPVYVDASVPGPGNGCLDDPFPTIAQAVAQVKAGGIVIIAPGTYQEGPLTYNQPMTLQASTGVVVVQ